MSVVSAEEHGYRRVLNAYIHCRYFISVYFRKSSVGSYIETPVRAVAECGYVIRRKPVGGGEHRPRQLRKLTEAAYRVALFHLSAPFIKIKPCIGTNTNNNYIGMCIFFKSKYKKE